MGLIDCNTPSGYSTCEGCHQPPGSEQPRRLRIFKYQELARATKSFSEKSILGKGSHSCVYKAVLSDGQVVAVKRPSHGRRTLQEAISFDNELGILSKLRYRHLVNLIGFCNEAHEKLLVVEYMENGTLYDVLHCSEEPLSWSARIYMALQAAKAILALHSASPPIIHRDVKSSNILIDRNWNAKLSDLGLALRGRLVDVARKDTPPAGTMGYIDPAYETPSQISSKSDVFSFGILLLEIMSGRKAIDVRFEPPSLLDWAVPLIEEGKALDVCDKALEPPRDLQVVKELAGIAARAVRQSKDRRPTMTEVVEGLQKIRQKLPSPRFGGKPLWAPRIAVPKGGPGEDSVSVSIEGSPAISFSPAAKFREDKVRQEYRSGESVPFSPPIRNEGIEAPPRMEVSRPTSVQKDELVRQDSGEGVSFSNWDALSIRNEGRVGPPRSDISRPSTIQKDELARENSGERVSSPEWRTLSIRSVSREGQSSSASDSGQSSRIKVARDDSGERVSSPEWRTLSIRSVSREGQSSSASDSEQSSRIKVARDDSGERVSSSKWRTSSIPSVSGELKSAATSDSEQSSRSLGHKSRSADWRFVDSNGEGLVSIAKATTQTFSSAVRAATTIKPVSTPIFDPTSAHIIIGSPLRIGNLARPSQVAPLSFRSPGLSAINSVVDRNTTTRRPLETPTFGSKGSLRTVDPPLSSISSAPGLGTQGTYSSRIGPSGGRGSGINDLLDRKSNLGTRNVDLPSQRSLREGNSSETLQRTSSTRLHVQLPPQQSLPERSSRHLIPEENRSTGETKQRTSSDPHSQLASQMPLREGSGRHLNPEQNRNTRKTQKRTSLMFHVQVRSQSSLQDGRSGQVPQVMYRKGSRERRKLSSFLSKPDVELASPQWSPREESSGLVTSKRNSKDPSDRQQLPFSSKPRGQKLASSQKSLSGGRISCQVLQKMNKDSRATQQRSKSSSKPHVQLESQRSVPEWSSQVAPKRKKRDSRETRDLSSSSSKPLPPESGGAATQKSMTYSGADISNGSSSVRPTLSFRMDMVVPIWDIPEPAGKFYTNSESRFKEVDLPIAV